MLGLPGKALGKPLDTIYFGGYGWGLYEVGAESARHSHGVSMAVESGYGWYRWSFWRRRWVAGPVSPHPSQLRPVGNAGWVWCGKPPTLKPRKPALFTNTFTLLDAGRAIRCDRCGLASCNRDDVANKYCGNCGYYD
jgi:hypothetical protein